MKKIFWVIIGIGVIFHPLMAGAEPKVRAETAVLIDGHTGEILWEKDAHKLRHPASTIKMLTCLIALEQGNLSDLVEVGEKAHQTYVGQTIELIKGDWISLDHLVESALLWSANDAAVAIAEHLAGDPQLFSVLMYHKAWALGAYNSSFRNPNGYSVPGQYSTAYDLALIARTAMGNPFFAETVQKREVDIVWQDHTKKETKKKTLRNVNKILDYYPLANGIKTGTTNAAGGCLVASAVKGDRWLIATVLGSSRRYADATALFEYGFENFPQ
ncbi:D-alanyl-D-alanine carboxypeptidase family protein [Dehalobacterium formicoaceticum]|uniref:D-alanyl-D-alanine carboxypeptidase n=1 Tax=Dehalobacterium formicoaceticum TaxID=51515 RepID=A0ABT1Y3Y0_9FIRM|nr:D-alanyl-D-alanine carboxypeptidase family protein [Dehalobacterium formicoaceticum]MCR6545579.1 D-alanyl-D-alanine carboxypeptidase [Dehalobacterium formicoaceticum]